MNHDVPKSYQLQTIQTHRLQPRVNPLHRSPPNPIDPPPHSRPTDPEEPVNPKYLLATSLIRRVRNKRLSPKLRDTVSYTSAAVLTMRAQPPSYLSLHPPQGGVCNPNCRFYHPCQPGYHPPCHVYSTPRARRLIIERMTVTSSCFSIFR